MTNIIKHIYYLLFIMIFAVKSYGQVLLNTDVVLNTGGYINDIANVNTFNSNEQFYLLAGNFSSVNGQASNGLQFISKATLDTVTPSRFSNVTNAIFSQGNWGSQVTEIKTVNYYKKTVTTQLFTYQVEHLYVGGTFQEVNGNTHVGFCLFRSFNNGAFILQSWDPDLGVGSDFNVQSSVVSNDTLFISGNFQYSESGVYDPNGLYNVTAFKLPNLGSTNFGQNNSFQNSFGNLYGQGLELHQVEDKILAYTSTKRYLINSGTSVHHLGNNTQSSHLYNFFGAVKYTDSTFISPHSFSQSGYVHLAASGQEIFEYKYTDASTIDTIYNPNAPNPGWEPKNIFYSFLDAVYISDINRFKDDFYFIGSQNFALVPSTPQSGTAHVLSIWKRNLNDTTNIIIDTIGYRNTTQNPYYQESFIYDNKLFYCPFYIDSIQHQPFKGLAVYCLEPMDVESFVVVDTTVCAGQDSVLYVVNRADYATEYKWEYSGTGMLIYQNNGLQPLDTLSPSSFHLASDSIYVKFDANFTPGLLTVTAMSECGVPSKPYSVSITSNPLPQITTMPDTTLNCLRDTIVLQGTSSTPNVTYTWHPNTLIAVSGATDTINTVGEYVFEVKDVIGCSSFDTVEVTLDTVSPIANPIPLPHYVDCANPTRTLLGSSNNPNDSIYWSFNNQYYSNPILASVPTASYRLIVFDRGNGCADSSKAIVLGDNSTLPNIGVQGYPNYSQTTQTSYIETLTCVNDTLNFTTISSTPNVVTNWTSVDSTQMLGNQLEITEAGTYYILATDTSNGCQTFQTVLVDIDTVKPIALVFPNQDSTLNCSYNSISIIGGSPSGNTNSYWTGPNGYTSSNPAIITTPGIYKVNVISINNGCMSYDSTEITYSPTISVDIGNDTTACNQQSITFMPTINGSVNGGVNYLWNNGSSDSLSSYVSGVDSMVVVEVFGSNNCYGTDSVYIAVPPSPNVQIASFKPCGAGNDGQIVVSPISGWTPFQYSIDNGGSFNTSGVFDNLTLGNYSIVVLDSLNCTYSFNASITDTSSLPSPMFLVQTYNFSSDTVILVDVSVPPTDSNQWFFPGSIQIIDSTNIAPVIVLPDTGSYPVTMRGFYGNCSVDLTKTIYALDYDTTYANASNANGIKSMLIYPNPNSGNFTVEIEFYKKQQAVITVQDISGNNYFYNQYGEVDNIIENITLNNVVNGTYILKIVSEFDSRYSTFIITQ